jgi:DNA repair protein RadD
MSGPFKEWICYEHTGYAREKACKWHKSRNTESAPRKVAEALRMVFSEPRRICTRKSGKYFEIVGYDFG